MSAPADNAQDAAQSRLSVGSRRALFEAAATAETLTPARGALSPRSSHSRIPSQSPPTSDLDHPAAPELNVNSRRTPSVGTLSALAELRKKFESAPHAPEPEPLHPPADSLSQRSLSSATSAGTRFRGTASSIGSAADSSMSESFLSSSASASPSPLSSANNSASSTPTITPAVRKKAHRKRASTGNKDDHGEEITSVEAEAGVLLKVKAKLFVLQSAPAVQWVEAGGGVVEFRMDRRVDKVMLWLADKKTKKVVMWHPVHPQIELKSNANKSWVWTTQDLAHLEQERPTVQTFAIRFKHSHLAKLFKTKYDQYRELNLIKEAQALEELKENRRKSLAMLGDEARASLHTSASPTPAPVTIAVTPPSGTDPTGVRPSSLSSSTPPRADPGQSSAPPSPSTALGTSTAKDRTGGSPMTAAAMEKYLQIASMSLPPHAHSYARKITGFTDFFLGDPTPEPPPSGPTTLPPLRDHPSPRLSPVLSPSLLPQGASDPDGAFQLSSAAAAAALTPSSPTARSKRTGTIARGGSKAARGGRKPDKAAKIMRFFGANVPSEALELQPEQQYEPSNPMAKAFPRMKALRYMKQSSSNVHDPLPNGIGLAAVKSRITVLNKVHDLVGLDQYVTQTMIAQLREENALLQAMRDSATPHTITLCLPAADANTEGSPKVGSRDLSSDASAASTNQTNASVVTLPMLYNAEGWSLDPLIELCDVNAFFHRQAASIALALENLKRSQQFRMPGAKHIPQRHENPDLRVHRPSVIQDMVNPNLFRAFTAFKDPPRDDESKVKVIRFEVTKINRIRKNTPRLLELDIATCSLTVLKNKNDEDSSGQCTHRECLITLETIIGVDLVDKNDRELSLSFYNNKADDESSGSKKTWRLIFESPSSRERFYRLMQIHMLSASEVSESTSTISLGSTSSGLAGLLRDRSEEKKKGTSPSNSASALNTYLPQPLRFTQKVKSAARQLPVVRLARTLHEVWSLQKLEEGWRYGSALDEVQLLHPHLVPFDQLKASQKAHFETVALQAAAAILTLGYSVQKRVDALDDEDEDDIYSGPGLGTISTDLVQLVEFLAENGHEAWAEQRISEGWVLGQENDPEKRTHPHLKPYNQLPSSAKETERNTAYKVIGSLLEWGYSIQKIVGGDAEHSVS